MHWLIKLLLALVAIYNAKYGTRLQSLDHRLDLITCEDIALCPSSGMRKVSLLYRIDLVNLLGLSCLPLSPNTRRQVMASSQGSPGPDQSESRSRPRQPTYSRTRLPGLA